jgi:hypothetical protein
MLWSTLYVVYHFERDYTKSRDVGIFAKCLPATLLLETVGGRTAGGGRGFVLGIFFLSCGTRKMYLCTGPTEGTKELHGTQTAGSLSLSTVLHCWSLASAGSVRRTSLSLSLSRIERFTSSETRFRYYERTTYSM